MVFVWLLLCISTFSVTVQMCVAKSKGHQWKCPRSLYLFPLRWLWASYAFPKPTECHHCDWVGFYEPLFCFESYKSYRHLIGNLWNFFWPQTKMDRNLVKQQLLFFDDDDEHDHCSYKFFRKETCKIAKTFSHLKGRERSWPKPS